MRAAFARATQIAYQIAVWVEYAYFRNVESWKTSLPAGFPQKRFRFEDRRLIVLLVGKNWPGANVASHRAATSIANPAAFHSG